MDKEVEIVHFFKSKDELDSAWAYKSIYEAQLEELAEIRNPGASPNELPSMAGDLKASNNPVYVYFPWRNIVLEMVDHEAFTEIKTNRNQLLIMSDEQKTLYNLNIAIAGMSVGSSILYGLVGTGIGSSIAIADDDIFSTSNLNRVQATVLDVDEQKVQVAKRKALEMNPFLKLDAISSRVSMDSIGDFITDETDIIFEEIDDFKMKLELRNEAKKRKIPFVMLTNLGDSVQIDIERYDIEPETQPFFGLVAPELIEDIKNSQIDQELMKKLSLALVDRDLVPQRAVDTLMQIGTSLVGRPQLYSTVALDGGIAPYLVRRIFLGDGVKSGRFSIKLSEFNS